MSTVTPDDDWLTPEEPPRSVPPPALAKRLEGVLRKDAPEERAQRFDSLRDALVEPPRTPEGEIRGAGGCMAVASDHDAHHAYWIVTALGRERLEHEIGGRAA